MTVDLESSTYFEIKMSTYQIPQISKHVLLRSKNKFMDIVEGIIEKNLVGLISQG